MAQYPVTGFGSFGIFLGGSYRIMLDIETLFSNPCRIIVAAPKNLLKPTQSYLNLSIFRKTPAEQCY